MIAEKTEKPYEQIQLENTVATVKDINQLLIEKYPMLAQLNYKIAVNQSLVEESKFVQENDEIALLPPFAGG